MEDQVTNPKAFISYSWSSPDHAGWVLKLATEMRECAIDVILDRWDLKEGHDAHAFMERMVTDPEIKKVLLICDEVYARKADQRSGGVGTEAQIITADLYTKRDQTKFVAIIKERDDEGNPFVPTYYKSRIYIDLSDTSTYIENFERLIRWIYDEPLYKKPDLGPKPSFLAAVHDAPGMPTSARHRRALDAVRNGRDHSVPSVEEYLSALATGIENFRIAEASEPFDDLVIRSIGNFTRFRNEAIELFLLIAAYQDNEPMRIVLHRFLEKLIPYLHPPKNISSWTAWDYDNLRFIVHEIFLYAVACQLKYERFEFVGHLALNDYYCPGQSDYGREAMVPFSAFYEHMESLDHRNKRLNLRRYSLRADLLEQRCRGLGLEFRDLMQADFFLYLRCVLDVSAGLRWWPDTLVYVRQASAPFEVFARSRSANYFRRVSHALGGMGKAEIQSLLERVKQGKVRVPGWHFDSINIASLVGYDALATKP